MADERNRWLDEAAAEKLLRGESVEPVGPAADPRARLEAARLRAALDALAGSPAAGGELPGEAAALAAFRAARGPARPEAPGAGGAVLDLGRITPVPAPASVPAPRRGRSVRFGLAAALASVAVGGLAAVTGAGLLDQDRHDSAGPGPAMSVSIDEAPVPGIGSGAPTPTPQLRPTPLRDGAGSPSASGTAQPPGTQWRTTPGTGTGGGSSTGTSATGGSGKDTEGGQVGGGVGGRDTFGNEDKTKDREQANRLRAVDLCKDYRAGRLNGDRRDRLSLLARGVARIPSYCESLLDGVRGDGRQDTGAGDGTLRAPTLVPASPAGSSPAGRDR